MSKTKTDIDITVVGVDLKTVAIPITVRTNTSNRNHKFNLAWKKGSKLLILIFILEVISIYGLLFFISPKNTSSTAATTPSENTLSSDRLIALTNQTRSDFDLGSLNYNLELAQAAEAKAHYILDNNNFDHDSLDGETFSTWIKQTDYTYLMVGENLAINYTNPEDIINAWLESPSHHKNLLNPLFEDIGIATVTGEYNNHVTTVIVQIFGTPQ